MRLNFGARNLSMCGLGIALGGLSAGAGRRVGKLHERRQVSGQLRFAGAIFNAAIDGVIRIRLGRADVGLERKPALGIGWGGCKLDLAFFARPLRQPLELIRASQRIGRQLAVDGVEPPQRLRLGVVKRHRAILQLDRSQRDVLRKKWQRARFDFEVRPVAAALTVQNQRQDGPVKFDLVGFKHAAQQRRSRQPHREAVGTYERFAGLPGRVGEPNLFKPDIRCRQKPQIDGAANPDIAAQDLRGLLLENAAITVPVNEIGHREERRQNHHQKATNV